jgi:signal peptidase I
MINLIRGWILLIAGCVAPGLVYFYLGYHRRFLCCFGGLIGLISLDGFVTGFDQLYHTLFVVAYLGFALPILFHSLYCAFRNEKPRRLGRVIAIATLCYSFILGLKALRRYNPYIIPAASMRPNLQPGDVMIADHWAFRSQHPLHGDMIVMRYPRDPSVFYIKRIIGRPEDRVRINQGQVYLNDEPVQRAEKGRVTKVSIAPPEMYQDGLSECRVYEEQFPYNTYQVIDCGSGGSRASVQVPKAHFYVLGDNRAFSSDSRAWGLLPKDKVVGKILYVYKENHFLNDFFNYVTAL